MRNEKLFILGLLIAEIYQWLSVIGPELSEA